MVSGKPFSGNTLDLYGTIMRSLTFCHLSRMGFTQSSVYDLRSFRSRCKQCREEADKSMPDGLKELGSCYQNLKAR